MSTRLPALLTACTLAFALGLAGGCSRDEGRAGHAAGEAAAPVAPAAPSHEEQAGHDAHTGALSLNNGARWPADAPLREGMAHIRGAVAAAHATQVLEGLSPAAATALAKSVKDDVAFLVANCKLEPAADATLHALIGELLAGVDALEQDPASTDAMQRLLDTLQQYPVYFDHPDWTPLAPPG